MSSDIRVLCVDDHPIVRDGIRLIIDREKGMRVVDCAASGEEALELFSKHRPDVTLMDLRLDSMTGLDAIKAIRQVDPDARIVVLTMYAGDEDIHRAIVAGATTYLLKHTLSVDLIRVIRDVYGGRRTMTADVAAKLEERAAHPTLTRREIEVINLVARGLKNRDVADSLGISVLTVEAHLKKIFLKLDVTERMTAVTVAVRRGIVHLD
jgi:DNA-binding NarL/FixJ family response regulator